MVIKNFGWILLGLAVLAIGFLPATRVPIIGDDFYVLFQAQGVSKGDIFSWISQAWGLGIHAGHFNPMGQVLGGLYHFFSLPISSSLNVSPANYYQIGAYFLLLIAVISSTYFLNQTLRTLNIEASAGPSARLFSLIATITGLTLQLHPWSNDPVTTYSMAGFGSASLGFLLLGLVMKSVRPNSHPIWMTIKVSSVAVFSVIYYELLVAAVAGAAIILLSCLLNKCSFQTVSKKRIVFLLGSGVVLPAMVFISGRVYVSLISGTDGYTGTVLGSPLEGIKTFAFSLISSIPGGAWPLSFYRVDPMIFSRQAFISGTFVVALLLLFAFVWYKTSTSEQIRYSPKIWIPFCSLLVFWWLSTAAQAMTVKYISEITAPGLVYLFYPIGMLSFSLIVAALAICIPKKRLLSWGVVLISCASWFGITQQTINWTLSSQLESAYLQNSELATATTNSTINEVERCKRLQNWVDRGWPEYYRDGVIENLGPAYLHLKGEKFCNNLELIPIQERPQ